MTTHLTVRLAWHDNKWNGTICKRPSENAYCVGSHSLLSERIARDRDLDKENAKPCDKLDALMPEYLPPCFWSSCAFSDDQTKIVHAHPFRNFRDTKRINETLPRSSVYTWPFRLSITHGKSAQNKHGQYPADLDDRVDSFVGRLTPDKSLVFFYLNYDNPVSADEYSYALVGCARISDLERSGEYEFTPDELKQLRGSSKTRNFPTRNWAIRVSYSFRETGVLLPYHEYLDYVTEHPDEEEKLDAIKVLVEEPTLLNGFKYVSEQINNDSCLYLLYKMRKAFEAVEEHGIVQENDEIAKIDSYIEEFWGARGLYPGLPAVVGVLGAFRDGDPDWESAGDCGLVQAVRGQVGSEEEVLSTVFSHLHSKEKLEYLNIAQQKVLRQARRAIDAAPHLIPILQRLSLFNLTPRQITRIVWPDLADGRKEAHPFGQRQITRDDITANPYLLCEYYKPFPKNESDNSSELDRELRTDSPIDYFTIDIGMFPDEDRYDCWDDNLLTLSSTGPERLRAFAVQSLRKQQDSGNTYVSLEELLENIRQHPLFYRKQFAVDREQMLADKYRQHFRLRLRDVESEGETFFYLEETKQAEAHVERFVQQLVGLPQHKADLGWVDEHLQKEAKQLRTMPNFDSGQFIQERTQLIGGVLTQRLFLVTGRPGSGKTRALREIVNRLVEAGQKVVILTPTGKAALRVRSEETGATVETIDRWINRCGLRRYVDDLSQLSAMQQSKYYDPVENLIIDETSMVDLAKLAVVCRAIEVHEPQIKRIILVGDENQLPPIGMGRPLYDILQWLGTDADRFGRHVVRLRSNCRQQQDRVVVDAAYLFAGKNRYHTELWGKMQNGEPISEHLNVVYWEKPDELYYLMRSRLNQIMGIDDRATLEQQEECLNEFFNLSKEGFFRDQREDKHTLKLDAWQLLSPYRGGVAGTLLANQTVREQYRANSYPESRFDKPWHGTAGSAFAHSDKIIRITNYYEWDDELNGKALKLSNGSIGVLCSNKKGRLASFPEADAPFFWNSFDEDDFEPAYAISVHKSQGSEFGEVFVIVPERRALLCRELVYTAMTRSTAGLTLLVQKTPGENPLAVARERSNLLCRNSSLFSHPHDAKKIYEPEPKLFVKSKVEYVIYEALRQARERNQLTFMYEEKMQLTFGGRRITVKPDFTVRTPDGRVYRWEHLGRLDREDYASDWRERRDAYAAEGLRESLVTSDDLNGIRNDRVQQIIADMLNNNLTGQSDSEFSDCHYQL